MVGKRIILLTLALSMGNSQAGWTDAFSFDTSKLSSALEHGWQKLSENRNSVGAALATGIIGASLAYYAAKRKPAVSDVSVATDPAQAPVVSEESAVAVTAIPSESDRMQAEAAAKDSRIRALEAENAARLAELSRLQQEKAELEKTAQAVAVRDAYLQSDLRASAQKLLEKKDLAEILTLQVANYEEQLGLLWSELAKVTESSTNSGELVKQKESELMALKLQLATSEDAVVKAKSELEVVLQRFQSLQSENGLLVQALASSEARFEKLDTEFARHRAGVAEKLAEYDKVMRENGRRAALLDSRQISADVSAFSIEPDLSLTQSFVRGLDQANVSDSAVFGSNVSGSGDTGLERSDVAAAWADSAIAKQITDLAAEVAAIHSTSSSFEDDSVVEAAASSAYVNVPFVKLSSAMQERVGKASPTFSPADAKMLEMGVDANSLILADMGSQKALHWLQEDGKSSFGGTKYKLEPFGSAFSAEIDILAFGCDQNYLLAWVDGAGDLIALVYLSQDDSVQVNFAEGSSVKLASSSRVKFEIDKDRSVSLQIDSGTPIIGNYYSDKDSTYYYIDKK